MAYVIGVVIFALGLLFSVCLHEAGHMAVAKALGMRVSRYFVGFGPTIFSFRRGETEYGLKAIPAGGFVSIDGMSPHVMDIPAEHEPAGVLAGVTVEADRGDARRLGHPLPAGDRAALGGAVRVRRRALGRPGLGARPSSPRSPTAWSWATDTVRPVPAHLPGR